MVQTKREQLSGSEIVMRMLSHLLAGGLVVSWRCRGLSGLAEQIGQHGARPRAAALRRAARAPLRQQRATIKLHSATCLRPETITLKLLFGYATFLK